MKMTCRFGLGALLVVVALAGFAWAVAYHQFWVPMTCSNYAVACASNLRTLDKAIAVWESQNVALVFQDEPIVIEFDTQGRIHSISGLSKSMADAAVKSKPPLTVGSKCILDFAKDLYVFRCIQELNDKGPDHPDIASAVHYRWTLSGPGADRRSARCLLYGEKGPRGAEQATHVR